MDEIVLVGKKIRELRVQRLGVSQKEFADALGMNRTFVSRVESGKQNLTIKNLFLVCHVLDITVAEFFSEIEKSGVQK